MVRSSRRDRFFGDELLMSYPVLIFLKDKVNGFREMCLASDFRRVEIVSTFGLPNRAIGVLNKHAIFHCFT